MVRVSVLSQLTPTQCSMAKDMAEDSCSQMYGGQEVERGKGRSQERVNPPRSIWQSPATSNQALSANSKSAPALHNVTTSKYST